MTDNLPAIRHTADSGELDAVDSWVRVVAPVAELAGQIADTEFIPRGLRGSAPAVAAAILYGREVGLPPMTALGMTHVVEGKPGISAEGMRALVLQAGHALEVVEASGAQVTMRGRRKGSETWTTLAWNLDMARAAGVAGKQVWQRYPRSMLLARCTTDLCRMIFPDVIHGMRSLEELEDMGDATDAPPQPPDDPSTTRVTRKRTSRTAKKSTPPPVRPAEPRDVAAGPPLPGEPGYDDPPTADRPSAAESETPGGGVDDGRGSVAPGGAGPAAGETVEDPAPSPGPDADPVAVSTGDGEASAGESRTPAGAATEQTREDADATKPIRAGVRRAVMAQFGRFDLTDDSDRDERLNIVSTIVERDVESTNKLTQAEGKALADTLARFKDRAALYAFLDTLDRDRAQLRLVQSGDDQDDDGAES